MMVDKEELDVEKATHRARCRGRNRAILANDRMNVPEPLDSHVAENTEDGDGKVSNCRSSEEERMAWLCRWLSVVPVPSRQMRGLLDGWSGVSFWKLERHEKIYPSRS
jgi:hypothetical protein